MTWWQFALLGAGGGLLVEVLALLQPVRAWQRSRLTPQGRVRRQRARLGTYVDLPAALCVGLLRALLGGAASGVFGASGQITGVYVAVALGLLAPTALASLGNIQQVAATVSGVPVAADPPTREGRGER